MTSFGHEDPSGEVYGAVWQGIEDRIEEHERYGRRKRHRARRLQWSAAAAIALLIVGGWFTYKQIHTPGKSFVIVQAGDHTRKIVLADSSLVVLNAHTILKYRPDNCRELWLNGEAFFNVKHLGAAGNKALPFTVHAGMEDIAVLGTAFEVNTNHDAVRVVLLRGKVKAMAGSRRVIMKPGEKTEWKNGSFSTSRVNAQLYLAWKDGEFHFDHTSLEELKELVKDFYGYDLVVRNRSSLRTTSISGTVSAGSRETLWRTLSLLFDAKIEKKGKQIILPAN